MDYGIAGRRALVAGSTSGLGRAVATALAAEGAEVVVTGRRAELVDEVAASLPGARGVVADLTADDGPEALAAEVGDVDVLVLNGGGPPPGPAEDLDAEGVMEATRLLLAPHVALVGALVPGMRERGWGRVLAIGSSSVQEPVPYLARSNIGRAGLAAYLKTLAGDVAGDGVTVNMVLPGRIGTDRVAGLDAWVADREGATVEEISARSQATIPVGRYGRVEEFAAVVAFLASDAASYVTGEQVRCDGGLVSAY